VIHVTEPGGPALAICAHCWREARASESQETARARWNALFAQPRAQIIRSESAIGTAVLWGACPTVRPANIERLRARPKTMQRQSRQQGGWS
jgi:hypothetical protein